MRALIATILLGLVTLTSCKKREMRDGKATVWAHFYHDGMIVPNCTICVSRGTSDFPGAKTFLYDDVFYSDHHGKVKFDNMIDGTYYFYAAGENQITGEKVWGKLLYELDVKLGERHISIISEEED